MALWPNQLDVFTVTNIDGQTDVPASWGNTVQEILEALEAALGLNPQGSFDTLADRLDYLEALVS